MGNKLTQQAAPANADMRRRYQQQQQQEYELRSKTLPTRRRTKDVNRHPHASDRHSTSCIGKTTTPTDGSVPPAATGESSRVLFLLYLIHRTWNVVVDTMDTRSKKCRTRHSNTFTDHVANKPAAPKKMKTLRTHSVERQPALDANNMGNCSISITDLDDDDIDASSYCSQYSCCSCSYCYDDVNNVYNSIGDDCTGDSICQHTLSRCESDYSAYYAHRPASQHKQNCKEKTNQMAPSICQNLNTTASASAAGLSSSSPITAITTTTVAAGGAGGGSGGGIKASSITEKSNCSGSNSLNGSMASYKMSSSEQSWPQATVYSKENQRPPVYNPEDYVLSLKKFGKKQSTNNGTVVVRSIYDTSCDEETTNYKSATLPTKYAEYKSPIPTPPTSDSEMTLRQFASITDLLNKLRADLRVSFPSFVQEFVATPSDGVSLLLEVLRAIQLVQASNAPPPIINTNSTTMPRNPQNYQRRALLDELACLQCLSICCSRSLDATARLGSTPIGLMPLASSATGQGIRARILALQLLAAACDKHAFGHGSRQVVAAGHTAVSEAMSTLRLRCSEPVRFRLLIGMLNSGGGSGELQCAGVRFINTFLDSAVNLQQRLYLQAELFQAGFEPTTMARTISSSSPWLDALRNELKRFQELHIDVDKMLTQARDAERVRSQMVILERRVQILHEEKAVLTSMERRLQERCAELQREIFRLQGTQKERGFKTVEQQTAVKRTNTTGKQESSEHEDEGISSSETGPSLSPVPILVLPQKTGIGGGSKIQKPKKKSTVDAVGADKDATTIEDVMEELDNIVNEAEKQCAAAAAAEVAREVRRVEQEIVPKNIVPQPPRKARSLVQLMPPLEDDGSLLDGSDYGMVLLQQQHQNALKSFFDEATPPSPILPLTADAMYTMETTHTDDMLPEPNPSTTAHNARTTRELLDVIMNARHSDDDPTMLALRNSSAAMPATPETEHRAPRSKRGSYAGSISPGINNESTLPPPQHFNGVFFMTGMNTPQKYPKPDLSAAFEARRVKKNIERLEAVFAANAATQEAVNEAAILREKSRSNQQIYFGSNPTIRALSASNAIDVTNVGVTVVGIGTEKINNSNNISARTRSYTQGSKVTDLPSGLY